MSAWQIGQSRIGLFSFISELSFSVFGLLSGKSCHPFCTRMGHAGCIAPLLQTTARKIVIHCLARCGFHGQFLEVGVQLGSYAIKVWLRDRSMATRVAYVSGLVHRQLRSRPSPSPSDPWQQRGQQAYGGAGEVAGLLAQNNVVIKVRRFMFNRVDEPYPSAKTATSTESSSRSFDRGDCGRPNLAE
jgi:hypothetical protein